MTPRKLPPAMTAEELRERIRALVGPKILTPEDRPCVRQPQDKGYFPTTKQSTAK